MPRPFTRAQTLENAAFLKALRRTGNAREAARLLGAHRAKFTKRRATHSAFATEWDAALVIAHAALGAANPSGINPSGTNPASDTEPRIIRTRSGRLQLRRAQRSRLTRAAEQSFLAALSATANVRLAAAAAGFSHSAFYHRRRTDLGFAREMRLALAAGYDRLEVALLESATPGAYRDDAWRHNDPPAMPPMTANQALQLLYLHQKEARLWAERPDRQRRRGVSTDLFSARLAAEWRAEKAREAEERAVEEADRSAGAAPRSPHEQPPLLPDLAQVTGWSTASGKPPQHDDTALFGGWRLGDVGKRD